MDMQQLQTLVGTVGFPIAAYILLFFQNTRTIKQLEEALNNNTTVIKLLKERLEDTINDRN